MIYPQRDNRRKKKKLMTITGIVGMVIVFIVVLNFWKPTLLSPLVHAGGRPFLEARGGFFGGIANAWSYLATKGYLVNENNKLKEQLQLLEAIETERDYYKNRNAEISKLVHRIEEEKLYSFADILSKPGFSPYDTLIINAGEEQGVAVGDHVLATTDVLVGNVSAVFGKTSIVTLYSSAERETPVFIGTSSIQAMAVGKGGGTFEIKLPKNTGVAIGDTVTMASSSAKIFGTIAHISSGATDTFERALFKSSVDVTHLSKIMIEKQ